MIVPGSNLLRQAARLIKLQNVQWSQNMGKTLGPSGVAIPTYAAPVTITGSVQAVPRALFEQMGLDFERTYLMFYTTQQLQDVERNQTPDLIDFGGNRYAVESNTEWILMDGWNGSIIVRTGATPS